MIARLHLLGGPLEVSDPCSDCCLEQRLQHCHLGAYRPALPRFLGAYENAAIGLGELPTPRESPALLIRRTCGLHAASLQPARENDVPLGF